MKTDFVHLFQARFWFWTPSAGWEGPKAWEVRQGLRVRIGIQSLCCTEALKAVKLLQGQMQTRRGERSEGCVGNNAQEFKAFPTPGWVCRLAAFSLFSKKDRFIAGEAAAHQEIKTRSFWYSLRCCSGEVAAEKPTADTGNVSLGNTSVRLNRGKSSHHNLVEAAFRQQRSTSQNG